MYRLAYLLNKISNNSEVQTRNLLTLQPKTKYRDVAHILRDYASTPL